MHGRIGAGGQAAMEQLSVYGWAIAAVLVIGVALWQMGIFNPSGGASAGYSGFALVRPLEWYCDSSTGGVHFTAVNAAGTRIANVTASSGGVPGTCDPTGVSPGASFGCDIDAVPDCARASKGGRYQVRISIGYTSATGSSRSSAGEVWGPAE